MLVLTLNTGKALLVGDALLLNLGNDGANQIQLGIEAPREVQILREEYLEGEARKRTEALLNRLTVKHGPIFKDSNHGALFGQIRKHIAQKELSPVRRQMQEILDHLKILELESEDADQ